jgi:tripartite-type tricarboxylate transporter receptor subunit TctC
MQRHLQFVVRTLVAVWIATATVVAAAQTAPQSYPTRPIRILVGVPPGGSTNTVARMVAQWLQENWGQPVIVENRPGANTAVAADAVARSSPDGYTVLFATNAHITIPLLTKLSYDPIKDFEPVGTIGVNQYMVLIHPTLPPNTLQDFIAYAKARPGELNYGSSGNGSGAQIAGELFNTLAGVRIQHVPYKGAGPALTDAIGGQVQVSFNTPLAVAPHVNAGKLKALAVTGSKRTPLLPNVPTFAEAGLPAYDVKAWYGVFLPAHTPKPIVEKLAAEIAKMIASPRVRDSLETQGIEPLHTTPEQFTTMMRAESAQVANVIRRRTCTSIERGSA